ncbi:MAG: molecular chaperone TorD family protein [Acidobacteria bacterium]|nr:molecular chaperone TorD family protein [Acidobacteriota bacterium]
MASGGPGPSLHSLAVADPATGGPAAAAFVSAFLARIFLDPPSGRLHEILERRPDVPLVDGLDARVETIARLYREADETELAKEWTRLFVGPRAAPCRPWHDSWQSEDGPPRLMGPKHASMLAFYRRAGLEPVHAESEPADHVGLVLALFAALAARAAEGEQILPDIHALWKAHVAPWIPRFAETLVAEARVPALEAAGRLLLDGVSRAKYDHHASERTSHMVGSSETPF